MIPFHPYLQWWLMMSDYLPRQTVSLSPSKYRFLVGIGSCCCSLPPAASPSESVARARSCKRIATNLGQVMCKISTNCAFIRNWHQGPDLIDLWRPMEELILWCYFSIDRIWRNHMDFSGCFVLQMASESRIDLVIGLVFRWFVG